MRIKIAIATFFIIFFYTASILAQEAKIKTNNHKWLGAQADVGVPDGIGLGVSLSPHNWVKSTISYTNNYFTSGGRFGITLDPINFGIGPSLTTEYGLVSTFNPSSILNENLPNLKYQYVNIQPGLEFGSRNKFRFFIHGGVSHIWGESSQFTQYLNRANVSASDPKFKVWMAPSIKLGISVSFL